MNKFYKLIIRKMWHSKLRLMLMTISFAAGIFLFSFIITIGLNIAQSNSRLIEDMVYLRQINVTANGFDQGKVSELRNHDNVTKLQIEYDSNFVIESIKGQIMVVNPVVRQINREFDLIISRIEYGDYLRTDQEIMISSQLLQMHSISAKNVLGESVVLTNGSAKIERVIVGVYDSRDDVTSPFAVMHSVDKNGSIIRQLQVEVDSIGAVSSVDNYIRKLSMTPTSHLMEIRQLNAVSKLIIIGFSFIGLLLLITSTTILRTTLKVSIKGKYWFIAMLRAQGYSNKKLRLIILIELTALAVVALVLGLALHGAALLILPSFVSTSFIPIQYINVFTYRPVVVLFTVLSSLMTLTIIAIKPIKMIQNCDVIGLLKEGEQ